VTTLPESIVCVTGASSGIGAACATTFARQGASLLLLARRKVRLDELARTLKAEHRARVFTAEIDVRKQPEVENFFAALPPEWKDIDILVNNAGLSRGLEKLHEGRLDDWEEMIDTNVKGLLYVTRAVLPRMVERNYGHVINIGSIAGHQTYPGGNVYSATKFAVTGLTRSLKMDLLGTAVRVSSVDPGLVETEFSSVRFHGDLQRAAKAYEGLKPLTPEDVSEAVLFCATRPAHVNIGEIVLTCVDQASTTMVHRKSL
jgi:3-hydroxy acid dehydrogenase / malonic semialdehyde reductase